MVRNKTLWGEETYLGNLCVNVDRIEGDMEEQAQSKWSAPDGNIQSIEGTQKTHEQNYQVIYY